MLGCSDSKSPDGHNPTNFNTGVIAVTDIPEFSVGGPFPGNFTFGQNSVDDPRIDFIIEVKHKDGRISMDFESSNQWIRYIQPARDRHEQNVEFYKDQNGTIFLRTTRKLKMGEQLYAWYSEPLARLTGVPFLSLQNIIGNQQYRCDKCYLSFRYPNPLKSHMMLKCKRQEGTLATNPNTSLSAQQFSSIQHMYPTFDYTYFLRNLSTATVCSMENQSLKNSWTIQRSPVLPHTGSHLPPVYPVTVMDSISPKHCPLQACSQMCYKVQSTYSDLGPERGNHADTINKIAVPLPSEVKGEPLDILPKSLLTKCKSGHICIFCGKFYSRKYGLKIHLRTHTGYKPLKCKICFRPFGDPSNLNKHVRLHAEGDTPYRCELCNKVLVRRRDLDRHIRSRHPESVGTSGVNDSLKPSDTEEDIIVT